MGIRNSEFINKVILIGIFGLIPMLGYNNCAKQFHVQESLQNSLYKDHQDLCLLLGCSDYENLSNSTASNSASSGSKSNSVNSTAMAVSSTSVPLRLKNLPGTFSVDCLDQDDFDACLFWKNPVAQRYLIFQNPIRAVYSDILQFGANLINDQIFGVKLNNRIKPEKLESKTFRVGYHSDQEEFQQMILENGKYKMPYSAETSHQTAQVMAYFWLNHMEEELIKRTGLFYPQGKNILVDSYITYAADLDNDGQADISVKDNASFQTYNNGTIFMGYSVNKQNGIAHELALSAEVFIHEMGHGNFYWATSVNNNGTPKPIIDNNENKSLSEQFNVQACSGSSGCFRAIHEGQADFYNFILFTKFNSDGSVFYTSPGMGETWFNNLAGVDSLGSVPRDPRSTDFKNSFRTATDVFDGLIRWYRISGSSRIEIHGEVHDMGAFYASILWQIYTDQKSNKNVFEKTFMRHLSLLNASSTFVECKEALLAIDSQLGSVNQNIIKSVFAERGL